MQHFVIIFIRIKHGGSHEKVMKIVGIVLLAIIVVAAVAFGLYWHHNTHWFDKYEKH